MIEVFDISDDVKRIIEESRAQFMPVVEQAYTIGPRKWFVIQTNPKCENKASDRVERLNFSSYMPKQKLWGKRNRFTRKMPKLTRPLMPGYLFLELPAEGAFDAVRLCDGVYRFVTAGGAPAAIPVTWVDDLRARERRGEFNATKQRGNKSRHIVRNDRSPFPEWVFPGAVVRIADGPFASFLGKILEAHKENRVLVEALIFGRATPIELEVAQVEKM